MTNTEVLTVTQSTVSEMITFMLPTFAYLTAVVLVITVVVHSIYTLIKRAR